MSLYGRQLSQEERQPRGIRLPISADGQDQAGRKRLPVNAADGVRRHADRKRKRMKKRKKRRNKKKRRKKKKREEKEKKKKK